MRSNRDILFLIILKYHVQNRLGSNIDIVPGLSDIRFPQLVFLSETILDEVFWECLVDVRSRPPLIASMNPKFLSDILYDSRPATIRIKILERALIRSYGARERAAIELLWEGKTALEFRLPCNMCFVCLALTYRCELGVRPPYQLSVAV